MTSPPLTRGALARVLQSLLTAELKRARGGETERLDLRGSLEGSPGGSERGSPVGLWPDALRIAGEGTPTLGCDSLEVMGLAAAANEMFHLYEAGAEMDLLSAATFGDWLDAIEAGWRSGIWRISFMTSGSTGLPKRCTHELRSLATEVTYLAELFPMRRRVLLLTPPHHIYGFLFAAMLPGRLGLEVVSAAQAGLTGLAHEAREGDLIVAVPDQWIFLNRTKATWPVRVEGVVSTAPCPPGLVQTLIERGLHGMTEVYGSSETAGVAVRVWPEVSYQLMPHWRFADPSGAGQTRLVHTSGSCVQLMDRIDLLEDGRLLLAGRQDGMVQIGGTNVNPLHVAALLRARPGVAEAAVRLMRPKEGTRLKAFIVAAPGAEEQGLRRELGSWIEANLPAVERPKALTFGRELPTDELGKRVDW